MKKLMIAALSVAAMCAYAEETAESEDTPIFWGFGNYGIYSGYQRYGTLVNPEPTLQGYVEGNVNLLTDDFDLGYLGLGVWSNTDLTDRRRDMLGKAFNEWDFNLHYGKTFWFDDDKTWGLDYGTSLVWYYLPHRRHNAYNGSVKTTMEWNHSVALVNPFLTPFVDWVHEYHESNADLLQFGVRRGFAVTDDLTLTPSATLVYRDHRFNRYFPTAGGTEFHNGGLATLKFMVEAVYKFTDNFGVFAKVAFCSTIDKDLRDASDHTSGGDCGKYKDFVWGGLGVTFDF